MGARETMEDRALGAMLGAALGDALGMPTQLLSPREIEAEYGTVSGFVTPRPNHPVSRGLAAGTVTDDTEQMLLLAGRLLDGEAFDQHRWIEALATWEDDIRARGGYDLLGPSTKRAIAAIRAGVAPQEAGRSGDTNGAAMRVAPVGIAVPAEPLDTLVARVAETCLATHNTAAAIASASAVAAAVSHGIDGGGWRGGCALAIRAARLGERHGHWTAGASVAARLEWAVGLVEGRAEAEAIGLVRDLVGTSLAAQESIPAAFAVLAIADGEPWKAGLLAAGLGGDTDTIGAIAGAIGGACSGSGNLPAAQVAGLRGIEVEAAQAMARGLVGLRLGRIGRAA